MNKIRCIGAHRHSGLTVLVIGPRMRLIELICVHQNSQNREINVQKVRSAQIKWGLQGGPKKEAAPCDMCVGAVFILRLSLPDKLCLCKDLFIGMTSF